MTPDVDVAILGGGCAGLSLAVALQHAAPGLRVQLLETRAAYVRDRTWSLWNAEAHPFGSCVTHSWDRWRVRYQGEAVLQQSARYRYQHIPSNRFYDFCVQSIHAAAQQEISMDTRVLGIAPADRGFSIETDRGSLRANWVFDSRPQPAATRVQSSGLVQRFTGWHVVTDKPCFDSTTVELMDFQPSTLHGRTIFFYTLPFSSTEALVEATYLDQPSLEPPDADKALSHWLDNLTSGGAYRVQFREQGALPMSSEATLPPTRGPSTYRRIGMAGGRVKASSGYAFLRIQRQSRAIAHALAKGVPPTHRLEPVRYALLDLVFLEALRRNSFKTGGYFLQLFKSVPPDELVGFLSETGSLRETFNVMLALPKYPFAIAAAGSILGARV